MRKLFAAALAAGLALSALPAQAQQFVNILTGGTSGVYYPLGVAISSIYADQIPDVRTSVQSTKASVENLNLLQQGRGELGFALGDSVNAAWQGDEEAGFPQKLENIRALGNAYDNYIQIVARADTGIRTLEDLRGKRVSVGAPRSGTELNARKILAAAGMSYDDLGKVEYLPFGESVELIKNRQLDATLQSAGLGVASIRDLAATNEIVVVAIPEELVEQAGDPAFKPATIPAGTYEGQTEDVPTIAIGNVLVTRADLSEELVYQMTKTLFENLDDMVAAHAAAEGITLESAPNTPIPLHPGAERYYREAGALN